MCYCIFAVISLIIARKSVNASIDAMLLDDGGLFLAALVERGGCNVRHAMGVFFWIFSGSHQQWLITHDLSKLSNISLPIQLSIDL